MTTNGWGGARRGAGRPRGKRTRRTEIRLMTPTLPVIPEKAHRQYVEVMPVDVLLQATRDVNLPIELRLAAAKAAAPYFHAKVSVGPPKATFEMTDMELDIAIAREKKYLSTGRDPRPPLIEGRVDDDAE
jgi:hypothetical protein